MTIDEFIESRIQEDNRIDPKTFTFECHRQLDELLLQTAFKKTKTLAEKFRVSPDSVQGLHGGSPSVTISGAKRAKFTYTTYDNVNVTFEAETRDLAISTYNRFIAAEVNPNSALPVSAERRSVIAETDFNEDEERPSISSKKRTLSSQKTSRKASKIADEPPGNLNALHKLTLLQ
jgi:hypothetical protein